MRQFLIILFIGITIQLHAQNETKLDSLIHVHAQKGFNGNVIYSKNDSIVFTSNSGFSNYREQILLNDSSLFDLASNSKQFTAFAIIQLIEKNELTYSTKVSEIIAGFPYESISIAQLLEHKSGLPDYIRLFKKNLYSRGN